MGLSGLGKYVYVGINKSFSVEQSLMSIPDLEDAIQEIFHSAQQ